MDGHRLLRRTRKSPDSNFDLFANVEAAQAYADGVGTYMVGPTVSRVSFFSVDIPDPDESEVERRVITQHLVLPTRTLLEFCVNFIHETRKVRESIAPAFEGELRKINELLDRVK